MTYSNHQAGHFAWLVISCCFASIVFIAQPPACFSTEVIPQAAVDNKSVGNKKTLQGRWQIMSIGTQGKVVKREDGLDAWKQTFAKDVIVEGEMLMQAQSVENAAKFTLDETHDPK